MIAEVVFAKPPIPIQQTEENTSPAVDAAADAVVVALACITALFLGFGLHILTS